MVQNSADRLENREKVPYDALEQRPSYHEAIFFLNFILGGASFTLQGLLSTLLAHHPSHNDRISVNSFRSSNKTKSDSRGGIDVTSKRIRISTAFYLQIITRCRNAPDEKLIKCPFFSVWTYWPNSLRPIDNIYLYEVWFSLSSSLFFSWVQGPS